MIHFDDGVVLVSSCLAGVACRYDGRSRPDPDVVDAVNSGRAIPVCAEELGGLPTPRAPAEILGGDGRDVLAGTARVVTIDGDDVTEAFLSGARAVARVAIACGVSHALLQASSPSCGCGRIYDGTHSGQLANGDGVVAAVLKEQGVSITQVRGRPQPQRKAG